MRLNRQFGKGCGIAGVVAATLLLAGCGSGLPGFPKKTDTVIPPPAPAPSTTYITWPGNSNGTTVLDAGSRQFAVDANTNTVVNLASNTSYTGLTANTLGTVMNNGVTAGSVAIIGGAAYFQYTQGLATGKMFVNQGAGWSLSMSNSSSAMFCLTAAAGTVNVTNSCTYSVTVRYCGAGTQLNACTTTPTTVLGYNEYGGAFVTIPAGSTIALSFGTNAAAFNYYYFGCSSTTGITPYPTFAVAPTLGTTARCL